MERDYKVSWWGLCFFPSSLPKGVLPKAIGCPHVTFSFGKSTCPSEFLGGKTYSITVDSYGNDGQNEGLGVIVPEELLSIYQGAVQPHITLSLSETAKAKDTGFLSFSERNPMSLQGFFGEVDSKGTLHVDLPEEKLDVYKKETEAIGLGSVHAICSMLK